MVREADKIVGFAHLWRQGDDEIKLFARTHPEARGRGIGSRLLALCDQRAAELRPTARRSTTNWACDVTAPDLLRVNGYLPIRHFVKMETATDTLSSETPVWPANIDCVRLSERPDQTRSLYNAWRDAFADEWGTGTESEGEFWQERRDSKLGSRFAFDPALWLLACHEDAVVGFCLCEIGSSTDGPVGRVARSASSAHIEEPGLVTRSCRTDSENCKAGAPQNRPRCRLGEHHRRLAALREGRNDGPSLFHHLGKGAALTCPERERRPPVGVDRRAD